MRVYTYPIVSAEVGARNPGMDNLQHEYIMYASIILLNSVELLLGKTGQTEAVHNLGSERASPRSSFLEHAYIRSTFLSRSTSHTDKLPEK
jgi:hypothetical protein